ncbi:MAG: hypothetical protein ACXWJ0_08275 [Xanthobacteraceae bacterium]
MHVESAPLALREWHEFYILLGTAAASLVALLFVAGSIGVGSLKGERAAATKTYFSPIVIHFSSVHFSSLIMLIPEGVPLLIEALLAVNAIVGTIVGLVVFTRASHSQHEALVFFDRFAYGAIPALAYVLIFAAAILSARGWMWSLHLVGAGVLALLLVNIRNAWDMMVTMVRVQSESRTES